MIDESKAAPAGWALEHGTGGFGDKGMRWVSIRHLESQCGQDFYQDRDPLIFGFLSALIAAPQPEAQEPAAAQAVASFALPDEVRVPLHRLWADAAYLIGRAKFGDTDLAVHTIKALCDEVERAVRAVIAAQPPATASAAAAQHPDDEAVDSFAAMLKAKLARARAKGRAGWRDPSWPASDINRQMHEHAAKGDPIDVAAYAMFLAMRGEQTAPAALRALSDEQVERGAADAGYNAYKLTAFLEGARFAERAHGINGLTVDAAKESK